MMMTAMGADGKPVELYKVIGGGCGTFDRNYTRPEDCFAEIDGLYDRIQRKAKDGVYPEAGTKTVILGGILSGMLAHEAVGHTVEADLVIGGSVAGPCLNKRVGSDLVNLVDFAHTAFGQPTPLPVYVDDEGTAATDAVLIKDGILVGYMNNRESAERFNMVPTGNARAYLFSDEPLIRMRNTAVLPGKSKLATTCWTPTTARRTPRASSCSASPSATRSRRGSWGGRCWTPPSPAWPSTCSRPWTCCRTR